ncbi:MAG: hypothetical protein J0M02_02495 [Planctomycetes bacterium]|nr:hypothetical protein [Planctomycetota bacterium]
MSAISITVQFSNGPRTVDAAKLRELVDTGRVTSAMRVASLDGGATWISVAEALAAASAGSSAPASVPAVTAPAESIPDSVLGESWGGGADAGDPAYSDGWERTPTRVVAGFLEIARAKLTSSFFLCGQGRAMTAGNVAILIAALIGIVVAAVNGVKAESFRAFLTGCILPVLLLIGQFVANRAVGAIERIIAHTRCSVRSRAALDLFALAILVTGLAAFATGIAQTVDSESHPGVINGIVIMVISWHAAALCFAPGISTTRVDHTVSAWKEAVGILGFLGKTALRLAPVVFGYATALLTWHLFWATKGIVQKDAAAGAIQGAADGLLGQLLLLALMPFIAYVAFTAWYATLALVESVFHIERQAAPKAQA